MLSPTVCYFLSTTVRILHEGQHTGLGAVQSIYELKTSGCWTWPDCEDELIGRLLQAASDAMTKMANKLASALIGFLSFSTWLMVRRLLAGIFAATGKPAV